MEGKGRGAPPRPKFSVYQNPRFSAALTSNSLRPSTTALLLSSTFFASALALFAIVVRKDGVVGLLRNTKVSQSTAHLITKILEISVGLALFATATALFRNVRSALGAPKLYPPRKGGEKVTALSDRQLALLGLKSKVEGADVAELVKKPPKSRPTQAVLEPLVPIRKSAHGYSPARVPRIGSDQKSTSGGKQMALSPMSPASAYSASPSTPWPKSASNGKGILTEEMLEQFLSDADEKIVETAINATATPPATLRGLGIASPSSVVNSATPSGATRSTPLRPVRMSPGSQKKYGTPPKKGEGELPPPMSIEQAIEGFNNLGIYPQIQQWRDHLRQWFSSFLLKPLLEKIETGHIQVMQAAAAVGVPITVSQVGIDSLTAPTMVNVSPVDGSKEWQPTFTLDEDSRLHQLHTNLVQARDGSVSQMSLPGQSQQHNPFVPMIQACIDAIAEHQRLNALMKGELVKGLLPQSTVRADYTAKRVRELSEGTCVKNYEYMGNDEKSSKKWTSDIPSDSHLLAYLFCAFLDHPKWMLHVDPTSYTSTQSSKNPLFLGFLPPKDRFPEKYIAVISGVPSIIHPGACILVIGKQNPPIFTLYWEKELQFSLQGRTAFWDAVLLLCHRIRFEFGGVVRGLHLGSPAFNILPIFEPEAES